jgi:archaellum component FlaC
MTEIKETEINKMTKLQNYMRGYQDAKADMLSVIEDIKAEIKDLHNSHMINFVSADGAVDTCLEIIDKHIAERSK